MKKILVLLALPLFFSTANATVVINDASFENINVNANSFVYGPTSSDWTFISTSGVIDPFSAFGSSEAPDGEQFGFVQKDGAFMQNILFPTTGNYTISFYEGSRTSGGGTGAFGYQISVGNSIIHTGNTTIAQPFTLREIDFSAVAGTHTLKFQGHTFDDRTGYFDAISITEAAVVPIPASLWLFGSGLIWLAGSRKKNTSNPVKGNKY